MSADDTRKVKADYLRTLHLLAALRHDTRQKWGDVAFYIQASMDHIYEYEDRLKEIAGMPKPERKQAEWQGFVDVKLTGDEKAAYGEWGMDDEDLWIIVVDAVISGHKLSVTHNKQNDQFVASFTGQEGSGKNAGFTLSAYAKDWYNSIRVLAFKHSAVLEGDWSKAAERAGDDIG
jgi:hypothetical protein